MSRPFDCAQGKLLRLSHPLNPAKGGATIVLDWAEGGVGAVPTLFFVVKRFSVGADLDF
jgi:hypothetical protein